MNTLVNYMVWGSDVSSPSGVRGRARAGNAFRRIWKATERYFLHVYADALSLSVFHVTFVGKAEV